MDRDDSLSQQDLHRLRSLLDRFGNPGAIVNGSPPAAIQVANVSPGVSGRPPSLSSHHSTPVNIPQAPHTALRNMDTQAGVLISGATSSSHNSVLVNNPHQPRNNTITRSLPNSPADPHPIPATDAGIFRPSPLPPHPSHPSLPLPIMPYQPTHASMHTGHPPTFPQPFLGIQSLGQGITRQVNWQRLVSASVNLPRQAALPIRTRNRCTRGPAVPPPLLCSPQNQCYVDGGNGDINIQLRVKVYPPPVDGNDTVFFYRFHRDLFNTYLRMLCLVYDYEVPSATLVSDLLSRVVDDMKDCSLTYSFVVQDTHVILDHKSLPLQLLSFVNRIS
ncbi:hypothetical protein L208DRAFT_1395738 [Tricholoma matsutake]|nr:hypothetical protein L208DRAFT_1395738 [Tricholoma matsutake 945]